MARIAELREVSVQTQAILIESKPNAEIYLSRSK